MLGHGAGAAGLLPAQAGRARDRRLLPVAVGRTIVYKGMLTTDQLAHVLPRPARRAGASARSRWCTPGSPPTRSRPGRWPTRSGFIAHNGEINTVRGNRNWMRAREALLAQRPDPRRPATGCSRSARRARRDSASFDEVLELLHLGGRSLPHAVLMMIPEAWENHDRRWTRPRGPSTSSTPALMEPWDGPACVAFTDGTVVGAVLDRNGLRPGRYWVTDDGLVVLASEVGVLDLDPADGRRARAGCSRAGCSWSTPPRGRIVDDDEIKAELAAEHAVRRLAARRPDPPRRPARARARRAHPRLGHPPPADLRLHRGGAADPARRRWPAPAPSRSARWAPTPRSRCCRDRPRLLFDYFTQLFAQVTNPPLDAIREELVTSLGAHDRPGGEPARRRRPASLPPDRAAVPGPRQRRAGQDPAHQRDGDLPGLRARARSRGLYQVAGGGAGAARRARRDLRARSPRRSTDGARIIVLSDRDSDADLAPIPSLLLTAAVHHHLVREQTRTQVGAGRRGRRRPRGAPRRAADRLRRRRGQPVPGLRVASRTSIRDRRARPASSPSKAVRN